MPFTAGPLQTKAAADATIIANVVAATATSTGTTAINLPRTQNAFAFILNVTAAAAAAGDTLDVFLQTTVDSAASVWVDIVHFAQILGNGGPQVNIFKLSCANALANFNTSSVLAVGTQRDLLCDLYRVRYVIVNSSAPSFTFNVQGVPM